MQYFPKWNSHERIANANHHKQINSNKLSFESGEIGHNFVKKPIAAI